MGSIEHLRHAIEDDASDAVSAAGAELPIKDARTLSMVMTVMVGGPVTDDDIERALNKAFVSLPIESSAAVLKVLNRLLDLWLGEAEES
ncbi:hypothetical protein [Novosphingobium sp. P6W]|uniref:hypothetical protein n=1 Tax=Novosphingobium sp. P6W TaxID=1609758 RepID=UPI0005C2FB0D|nr:hypothetical protein [Novosphingobium sp. P6W]AXB80732.1 hypothetical protein TQ38_029780 [Novosphingobium sp. P6W]KIS29543.1 hypothetical protein TQ38_27890 [Novosphingobium sp. P6W]